MEFFLLKTSSLLSLPVFERLERWTKLELKNCYNAARIAKGEKEDVGGGVQGMWIPYRLFKERKHA